MNSMDTPHPTLFFFLSLTILLYLFSHSWLGTGMCTSSHVMARRRSPLSLPCGTNDNQRILTNLIVCDRRRLSPIPASLLNIKSRLHAPRFVCKEVVFFKKKIAFECVSGAPFDASAVVSVPVGGDRKGGVAGAGRASPADTNRCGGSWVMFVNTH